MRLTNLYLPTVKEIPSDEHRIEKQLMIRAGMEKKISQNTIIKLPLGVLTENHIKEVIKSEFEKISPQQLKITNSEEKLYNLTTSLIRNTLKSYKQLPVTVFVDDEEISYYTFDSSEKNHASIVKSILDKLSVDYYQTESNEFYGKHLGDEEIIICEECEYTEKKDKALSFVDLEKNEELKEIQEIHTPNAKTIEDLVEFFQKDGSYFAKSLLVDCDGEIVMAMVPGDKDLSINKLATYLNIEKEKISMAENKDVEEITGAECGFAGPVGLKKQIRVIMDKSLEKAVNMIVGGNKTDYHLLNVNYGRDFQAEISDSIIEVEENHLCPSCMGRLKKVLGQKLAEVNNLGQNYNPKNYVEYLDKEGKPQKAYLTETKINPSGIISTIIAQNHDEKGILYKGGQGPFDYIVTIINPKNEIQVQLGEKIYNDLKAKGKKVILDDRDERAGVKFADAELIGIPHQITVGKLAGEGKVEYTKNRENKETITWE